MVTALKALHIAALIVWCAGLVALPLLLARHDPSHAQSAYARLRLLTDTIYRLVVTPAAVVTIIAGTTLVFLRDVYPPWMLVKLAVVGLLVCLHAWLGLALTTMGETAGQRPPPGAALPIGLAISLVSAVLLLVLAKPSLTPHLFPDWLLEPRYRLLPVDESTSSATPTW